MEQQQDPVVEAGSCPECESREDYRAERAKIISGLTMIGQELEFFQKDIDSFRKRIEEYRCALRESS